MNKKYKKGYIIKWDNQEKRYTLHENALAHYDRLRNKNIDCQIIRLSDNKIIDGGNPLEKYKRKLDSNPMSLLRSNKISKY